MRKKVCPARRTRAPIVPAILAILLASASHAQQNLVLRPPGTVDWDVGFGAGHSDNVLRLPVDPVSGEYRFLGTSFDYVRDGSRFDADFAGDVEVREYSDPNIDDEPIGSINLFLNGELLPSRVSWVVNDNYGIGRNNPFVPSAPQNRQEINVFSTGPRIDIPLGQRTSVALDATRAESNFQESSRVDSDSEDYELTFNRQISTTMQVGFGGAREDVEFEGATDKNVTKSYFLLYDRQLSSGGTGLRVGRTEVEVGSATFSSPLLDLSWVRNLGTRTRLGVTATKGFSDAATSFVRDNGATGPGTEYVIAVRDPYEFERLALNLAVSSERTTFTFSVAAGESRYTETTDFDNDDRWFDVTILRELRATLRLGASAGRWNREFVTVAREDTDRYRELFLDKEFSPRWSMRFTAQQFSRDQGTAAYDEDTVRLEFNVDLNR
jgi:hypothetical protein